MKIHLVRFFVLRTIPVALVVEVGINSRRVFGGGIACIASGGFSFENSRTKNSRRECRLSVLAIPVGMRARVGAFVRAWVSLWVSAYPRAYVCACVCSTAFCRYSVKKPDNPQKRLKFGLILPYWYKTTKTDYKRK